MRSRASTILIPLLLLWPNPAGLSWAPDQLVIWNVGQGQWATLARGAECLHFDLGGEVFQPKGAALLCRGRRNLAFFSHWDLDHINFAERARRAMPNLCIAAFPGGHANPKKRNYLKKLNACGDLLLAVVTEHTPRVADKGALKSNESSRIYISDRIVFPGDAGARTERRVSGAYVLENARILVLGHHGSRTSTSEEWLGKLKRIRLSIASARRKRYGHPHPVVIDRMRKRGIPVVITEDWGNVRVKL